MHSVKLAAGLMGYLGATASIRTAVLDLGTGSPETAVYFAGEAFAVGSAATWILVRRSRLAGCVLFLAAAAASLLRFLTAPVSVPYGSGVWLYAVVALATALGLLAAWLAPADKSASPVLPPP